MKRRGVLTLMMAAALLVAPPVLESAGVNLPVMTVTASGNNSSTGNTGSSTTPRPSTSGNNSYNPGSSTGSGSSSGSSTGSGSNSGSSTGTGSSSGTTNRPSASGNNSYNPGSSSNAGSGSATVITSNGTEISSTITVNNSTGMAVVVTTSRASMAAAAGLTGDEHLVATITGEFGPIAEQVINGAAASAGAKVASIFDIKLTIAGRGHEAVTELSSPIRFVMEAPEGIDGNANDFAIVRVHNGAVSILQDLDSDPATITFESDRFSAYAVIYAPKGQLKGVKDSVPKTGDTIPAGIPVAATTCLAAAACAAVAQNKRKKA